MPRLRRFVVAPVLGSFALLACGGGAKAPKTSDNATRATSDGAQTGEPADGERQTTALVVQGAPAASSTADAPDAETPQEIYGRVQADLVACFQQGRKAAQKMSSGRITLNVSIDAAGKATCVVPSDDTGLTQEVEDCMRMRMARETFKSNGAAWATELPIVVKNGAVSLGPPATAAPAIETVETHGLPDSAHEVVEALLPALHKCTEANEAKAELRVMHVGARVGKDGRVECALASSPSPLPPKMRDCAASVLAGAKFPEPKSSVGLVAVPVKILSRK